MSQELEDFNAELKRVYATGKLKSLLVNRAEDDFVRRLISKGGEILACETKDTKKTLDEIARNAFAHSIKSVKNE